MIDLSPVGPQVFLDTTDNILSVQNQDGSIVKSNLVIENGIARPFIEKDIITTVYTSLGLNKCSVMIMDLLLLKRDFRAIKTYKDVTIEIGPIHFLKCLHLRGTPQKSVKYYSGGKLIEEVLLTRVRPATRNPQPATI